MVVRLRALPKQWQNAGLCRLPLGLMDEMQITPGDLLRVENCTAQKYAFARVFVRNRNLNLVDFQPGRPSEDAPEIELDPSLIDYLELQEKGQASISLSLEQGTLGISAITFITTEDLSDIEKLELTGFIKNAGWPVYPGAKFAVNLTGRPIVLKTFNNFTRPAVVQQQTVVSLKSDKHLEILWMEQDILAHEGVLKDLERQERLVQDELKHAGNMLQELEQEEKRLDELIKQLESEQSKIASEFALLLQKEVLKKEELKKIHDEGNRLDSRLQELREWIPPDFDLEAKLKERDEAQKAWDALVVKMEEKIRGLELN